MIGIIFFIVIGALIWAFILIKNGKTDIEKKVEKQFKKKIVKLEKKYEKEKQVILEKDDNEYIQDHYNKLQKSKEAEINKAVDEAMMKADKYKKKG